MFVKRVIAEEGDQVRIVSGQVYTNDVPLDDDAFNRVPEPRGLRPTVVPPQGYYFVMGDPQQQFRQPALGLRAEEIHHREGGVSMVAVSRCGPVGEAGSVRSCQAGELRSWGAVKLGSSGAGVLRGNKLLGLVPVTSEYHQLPSSQLPSSQLPGSPA